MAKEPEDTLNPCGHRNSERVKALKEFPSAVCPACLLEMIKELKERIKVLQRNRNVIFNQKTRNYARIVELEAENKKLIEGQKAKIEAGS